MTTPKESAGLLLFRRTPSGLEVLLGHMGGPLWANKDIAAWSIPKGASAENEALEEVALREFEEETGHRPSGAWLALPTIVQRSGKRVHVWAVEGDLDPALAVSNTFPLEWPPRSGRIQHYPEMDRVAWFTPAEAVRVAVRGQGAAFRALQAAVEGT